ncbi:ethanolamine permease [Acetobacter sp.]|jgi:ethanolamine permease|uniref:ethanolamine permease n=1 Tax=Acetobacter sp. TaxID=440 RepID=UPI0025C1E1C4|nr:ethanolamine permease [Acetobacter sp.]MCH4091712.1 ethanolamine permease [Acetobacter sp.]MCI1300431.1 ethanolamine permease [Acetobacter sp.]MCI1316750.1 ethanolamine permease [Acetobacter sp.]
MTTGATKLNKTLSAFHLWGIGVGLVISGEYFGWSYGWGTAGTLGFMIATIFVALMYTSFIFSFTELTTAIPHAGGPFTYSFRALGPLGGLIAGLATLVEFIFAPPAIALAIGAYLNVQFPALSPKVAAVGAYIVFMALNIVGVHIAASFELFVTIAAIIELLVFMGVVAPAFSWDNFIHDGWGVAPHFGLEAMGGIFAAIPFAIWFFLAIEGVAMAAEEAKDPKRSIPVAYIASVLTLVSLAFGVMIFAGGVGDWKALANLNDPLPEAMKRVVGTNSGWLHMLVWLGLFGLVASLHGIIMGYARQIFALARAGFLPAVLGKIHPRFQTPYVATIAGGIVGIAAIFSDDVISIAGQSLTATLVTMSVFGALTMYILSMISLFVLRRKEPNMERSYRAPLYPILPALALSCAIVALAAVIFYNTIIFLIYIVFVMILSVFFMMRSTKKRLQAS